MDSERVKGRDGAGWSSSEDEGEVTVSPVQDGREFELNPPKWAQEAQNRQITISARRLHGLLTRMYKQGRDDEIASREWIAGLQDAIDAGQLEILDGGERNAWYHAEVNALYEMIDLVGLRGQPFAFYPIDEDDVHRLAYALHQSTEIEVDWQKDIDQILNPGSYDEDDRSWTIHHTLAERLYYGDRS